MTGNDSHRFARRCYGHLAGKLGVAVTDALVARGVLRQGSPTIYDVTASGRVRFEDVGVIIDAEAPDLPRAARMIYSPALAREAAAAERSADRIKIPVLIKINVNSSRAIQIRRNLPTPTIGPSSGRSNESHTMSSTACSVLPEAKPARLARVLPDLLALVTPIAAVETVPLAAALGRVLAEPVRATLDVPPWDNAAMDGYAVALGDLQHGGETTLPVAARVAAGHPLSAALPPGHAARIFTGAPMPAGADTVVMQEHCRAGDRVVTLPAGTAIGANVRRAGDDLRAGAVALPAGRRLGPVDLGLAAAAGASRLVVRRRPRVAVFSTGDELREPGAPLPPGSLNDSNRYTLLGLLGQMGCAVTDLGILPDRPEVIAEALAAAAECHDALVTSGGMSVGEEDHIRAAVAASGGRVDHWRLAIKPGKPVGVGRVGKALFLGLPGNPAAVVVTFLLVARPLLQRLSGAEEEGWPRFAAAATFHHNRAPGRREYLAARLECNATGAASVSLPGRQGSHILSAIAAADVLVELPEDSAGVRPGDMVAVLPLLRP
ncbi:MAG: gephyrin-like molybdotransferase Glp [Rhodospirillaceae bacterium]